MRGLRYGLMAAAAATALNVADVYSTDLYTGGDATVNTGVDLRVANPQIAEASGLAVSNPSGSMIPVTVDGPYGTGFVSPLATTNALGFTLPSAIGTGDFTIEGWMLRKAGDTTTQWQFVDIGSYSDGIHTRWQSGNDFTLYINNVYQTVDVGAAGDPGGWHHIAIVRSAGVVKLYVNGVDTGLSWANSANITRTATKIGYQQAYAAAGYCDVHITKSAKYTAAFTPPAAPVASDANTIARLPLVRTHSEKEGGLLWAKSRTVARSHGLVSSLLPDRMLATDSANNSSSIAGTGFSFTATGFNPGTAGSALSLNESGASYLAQSFKQAPDFYGCVIYRGNGVAGRVLEFSHLKWKKPPGLMVFKRIDTSLGWYTAHRFDYTKYLALNQADAASTFALASSITSSSITLPNDGSSNAIGGLYILHLFGHDPDGIIQCGSYIEPSTASEVRDINLGGSVQSLIAKSSSATGDWWYTDTTRGFTSGGNPYLRPNVPYIEGTFSSEVWKPTATGFSQKGAVGSPGGTMIYIAIRAVA